MVTAGWHVLCFDHNLKLMWDQSIKVPLATHRNIVPSSPISTELKGRLRLLWHDHVAAKKLP